MEIKIDIKDMIRFVNFQGLEFYAIPAKFIDALKKEEDMELDLIQKQKEHLAEELKLQKEAEEYAIKEAEIKAEKVANIKALEEKEKADLEAQKLKDIEIADALKKEAEMEKAKLESEAKALKKAELEAQLKELED